MKDTARDTLIIAAGIYIGLIAFAFTMQKVVEAKLQESGAQGSINTLSNIFNLFANR